MGQMNEKTVSNDRFFRGISDKIDVFMNWKGQNKYKSRIRRIMHGSYHAMIGIVKGCILNFKGSKAEFKRAGWQFKGVIDPQKGPKDT